MIWPQRTLEELATDRPRAVDPEVFIQAAKIVETVRRGGEEALRRIATELGDLQPGEELFYGREELETSLEALEPEVRSLLERTAGRIRNFAKAQAKNLKQLEFPVPGGAVGHEVLPVERAGCYAPGGRYPLPSSVLMTAVTARAAGVDQVWLASPRPGLLVRAAAAIAGVDGLLKVGGAQAVAGLALGVGPLPPSDVIVGPGNQWVTAAKQHLSGEVRIDMLAGPSELVVLADAQANAEAIAAHLLAQAEHDPRARPILVTTEKALVAAVKEEVERQWADLPTRDIAEQAFAQSFWILTQDLEQSLEACDLLATEHLHLMTQNPQDIAKRIRHAGALFIGANSAEVLGDYGIGPNHTLPTGGIARNKGGLSVFDFLRIRTWMRVDRPEEIGPMARDAADLARLEGLEAHARSAEVLGEG